MPAIQHKRQTIHCTHRLGGPIISHECQTQGLSNSQNWNLCNYRSVKSLKTLTIWPCDSLQKVPESPLSVCFMMHMADWSRKRGGKNKRKTWHLDFKRLSFTTLHLYEIKSNLIQRKKRKNLGTFQYWLLVNCTRLHHLVQTSIFLCFDKQVHKASDQPVLRHTN